MTHLKLIGLYFLVLVVISITISFIWIIVRTRSRLDEVKKVENFWIKASEQLSSPHKWWFVLCLIYGIGFNCIIRSFLYSVLQVFGILRIDESLGFLGEYVISCICTIISSFVVTAMYKIEGGTFTVVYSAVVAISVLPTGLLKLIDNYNEVSVATWVVWPISIAMLSLVSSLVVFKFANFAPLRLKDSSTEHNSVDPGVGEPGLTEPGSNEQASQPDGYQAQRERDKATKQVALIFVVFFGYMCVVSMSSYVQRNLDSDETKHLYSSTLLINLAQLMELIACGALIIFIQSQAIFFKLSLRNWGWFPLPVCFVCYAFEYVGATLYKMMQLSSDKEVLEFISIEIFRTPFKYAAVGFICSASYFIVCLKIAKKMLSSIEASELGSFEPEESQYA